MKHPSSAWPWALVLGLSAACGDDVPTASRQPGIPRAPEIEARPAPGQTEPAHAPPYVKGSAPNRYPPLATPSGAAPAASAQGTMRSEAAAAGAETGGQAEERDFGQELVKLLDPRACLDLAKAAERPHGRTDLGVTAMVMPSGRITRATVTAPGQAPAALTCLEAQLEHAHLPAPIPDAPRSVSESMPIEILPVTAEESAETKP